MPQADLDDLRARLARTRWPDQLRASAGTTAHPSATCASSPEYWRAGYDWRVHERELNGFAQFTTTIQGQRVHFMHVRSAEPDAVPLIMTHGWPGSVVEFTKVIGPLTDPRGHGGDPADAFHLVLPSIPGYGFSGPTSQPGWNVARIALAWDELMTRLGYQRYGAQGGDWGSAISRELGMTAPGHVIGVHLNMLIPSGSLDDPGLTDVEKRRLDRMRQFRATGMGYSAIQSTRPQTLAYALTDSPAASSPGSWTSSAPGPTATCPRTP